ncbi:MAG: xylose isomerase, partial [Planctomycetes bacterium]|nr:xylose isomerase [Planctomycetota bacterium]
MDRRTFITRTVATGAAIGPLAAAAQAMADDAADPAATRFRLAYAPHPGMFRHHAGDGIVDQIRFAADQGFHAWEDNGMLGREVAEQERIGSVLRELGMTMGVF